MPVEAVQLPRVVVCDTYYPAALAAIPFNPAGTYDSELANVLAHDFGTGDFYSHNLRELGWKVVDIIANHGQLQNRWANEQNMNRVLFDDRQIALSQIATFKPDVVFLQDLSFFKPNQLALLREKYLLVGQCSCPWPSDDAVTQMHLLFTSFPHYVEKFQALGVRAEYLPLAFEPRMLEHAHIGPRDTEIAFVGGVGRQSHWKQGTNDLEAVAMYFGERLSWHGYGGDNLPPYSPLRACWCGDAWGLDMYERYSRSKIVVNRHGEVAQGYANNLRMYEATGMGALLITENAPNLAELFPEGTCATYSNTGELIEKIKYYLDHEDERSEIARNGQEWTLMHHTYKHRMQRVSDVLNECLAARVA